METNSSHIVKQYMVDFSVPPLTEDLMELVPEQRDYLENFFTQGKLLSYSFSLDQTKLWAVMMAASESELILLIDKLPMTPYMDYNYHELMLHNTVHLMPSMSLN